MNKKILFINHGVNSSGWGYITENLLKVLSKKFDVVNRVISLNNKSSDPKWIKELSDKSLEGVTHVLQYVLPQYYQRYPNVRNIGLTEIEYTDIYFNEWLEFYELMDEIWTPNKQSVVELRRHLSIPVKEMKHYIDLNFNIDDFEKFNIKSNAGNYNFYTIAENIPRKNLKKIIEAYHCEFDPSEPVSLMIRSSNTVVDIINEVKRNLQLYVDVENYSSEILFPKRLSRSEILSLHKTGDCYLNASIGESFGVPVYEAIKFKNDVITNAVGGLEKFPNKILHEPSIALGGQMPHAENARNICQLPNVITLMTLMRKAYENKLAKPKSNFLTSEEKYIDLFNIRTNN